MSTEETKAIGERWFNAWYHNKPDGIADLVEPEFTRGGQQLGADGAVQLLAGMHRIWTDGDIKADEVIGAGDGAIVRFSGDVTHSGTINHPVVGAIPATSRRIRMLGINFYRIMGGKVTEEIYSHDTLGVFLALCAVQPATPVAQS